MTKTQILAGPHKREIADLGDAQPVLIIEPLRWVEPRRWVGIGADAVPVLFGGR
jgi:hypothetical protein